MIYDQAKKIADEFCQKIFPYTEPGRLHIAGSLRRKRSNIGDIEIVCIPLKNDYKNIFGETIDRWSCKGFIDVVSQYKRITGQPNGRQMKMQHESGIVIDMYMPQPHDYFRMYAVRTGSKDYSMMRLAGQWSRMGWHGTSEGLRRKSECHMTKSGYKCFVEKPQLPPAWQSEEEFFKWLEIYWEKPEKRNW